MKTVTPRPEFTRLTEEEIFEHLDAFEDAVDAEVEGSEGDEDVAVEITDPIVAEVDRLIEGYAARLEEYCKEHDEIPEEALSYSPATDIERVAFQIFTEALHDSLMDEDEDE